MTHCIPLPRPVLLGAACALAIVAPARAQDRTPAYNWSELRRGAGQTPPSKTAPSRDGRGLTAERSATIGAVAVLAAEGGAWLGLISGMAVGGAICNMTRDRSRDSSRLLPGIECVENDFQVYGAALASFAASSVVVMRMSEDSGCDFNDARRRALRGAMLGTLPSIAWMAVRPSLVTPGDIRLEWTRDVTTLVVGTPVLQAVGATIAASRCRRAR